MPPGVGRAESCGGLKWDGSMASIPLFPLGYGHANTWSVSSVLDRCCLTHAQDVSHDVHRLTWMTLACIIRGCRSTSTTRHTAGSSPPRYHPRIHGVGPSSFPHVHSTERHTQLQRSNANSWKSCDGSGREGCHIRIVRISISIGGITKGVSKRLCDWPVCAAQ